MDAEACFVPFVHVQQDGVVREFGDAAGENLADLRGFEVVGVGSVGVEEAGHGLVEEFAVRAAVGDVLSQYAEIGFENGASCVDAHVFFEVGGEHEAIRGVAGVAIHLLRQHLVTECQERLCVVSSCNLLRNRGRN